MRVIQAIALLCLLLTACGRRGPLVPPEALVPAAVKDLQVVQRGDGLQIAWTIPSRLVSGGRLEGLAGFKVMRADAAVGGACQDCSAFSLLKVINLDYLEGASRFGDRLFYRDTTAREGSTYNYRVVAHTRDGVEGKPSPPVRGTVRQTLPAPALRAVATPTSVLLTVAVGQLPAGSDFDAIALYRAREDNPFPLTPLTRLSTLEATFEDQRVEQGVRYRYAASVQVRISGDVQESALSDAVVTSLAEEP
jgi:predicted small lipoprotein YifL